jgi:hypothetical protein
MNVLCVSTTTIPVTAHLGMLHSVKILTGNPLCGYDPIMNSFFYGIISNVYFTVTANDLPLELLKIVSHTELKKTAYITPLYKFTQIVFIHLKLINNPSKTIRSVLCAVDYVDESTAKKNYLKINLMNTTI